MNFAAGKFQKKRRKVSLNRSAIIVAAIFMAPVIIRLFISSYLMSFQSVIYSFYDYNYADPPGVFVGLGNYATLLKSELFWKQIRVTITLWAMGLIAFPIPIIQALFLNEIVKGHKFFTVVLSVCNFSVSAVPLYCVSFFMSSEVIPER